MHREALAAGADLALRKPCLPDELREAVRTFLNADRGRERGAARARTKRSENCRRKEKRNLTPAARGERSPTPARRTPPGRRAPSARPRSRLRASGQYRPGECRGG